jgi:hypothetical protein
MSWIFHEESRKRVLGPLHCKLYTLLKKVQDILYANQIDFWAIAGTALGAGRHSAIIPWDDDIDLGIHESEAEKLKVINWEQLDCTLEPAGFGFKVFCLNDSSVFIDFFLHRLHGDVYEFVDAVSRKIWPKYTIHKDILYPLKFHTFGDSRIRTVNDIDEQLKKYFGNEYNSVAYIILPHGYSSGVNQFLWRTSPFITYLHNKGKFTI